MLYQVGDFCGRVDIDLAGLIDEIQDWSGFHGDQFRQAYAKSLPRLSVVLAHPELSDFHISLGTSGHLALEYRLPASSSWCDAVLLGRSIANPSAVILELKDWDITNDRPGPREALINHHGNLVLHPSDQVRGYVEYCRRFHSAVAEFNANVDGCVYFTTRVGTAAYTASPHAKLTEEYPVFSSTPESISNSLVPYLKLRLTTPFPEFANAFDRGGYRQDRNFVSQVALAIRSRDESPFVLLDEQRQGFEHCMDEIDTHRKVCKSKKMVVIIEGPPGSGKSVLAAHIWAALAENSSIDGNKVFVTTSGCQRKNWEHLFEQISGKRVAKGLVIPANRCNPGVTGKWVSDQRKRGAELPASAWESNLEKYYESNEPKIKDGTFAVSVTDEAHALIDPTVPEARGATYSGWTIHAGPQAFHVMRCSDVSVFLMDSEQSYRDNETTTPERLLAIAAMLGINDVKRISLAGRQYRCGGSQAYMDWLDGLLANTDSNLPGPTWNSVTNKQGEFKLEIVQDPGALDEKLRHDFLKGRTVRLAATYARPWKTKELANPHNVAAAEKDFSIQYNRNGQAYSWDRIWNHVPNVDYTLFIQGIEGSAIHQDPLCEVGCPYVIRGFDFDYLGVLWFSDLVWRGNQWKAQVENVFDSGLPRTLSLARGKRKGRVRVNPDPTDLLVRLKRCYRILLSRAIHGIYLWVEDEETRMYLKRQLGQ
jgi:DUF2075 family protein